MGLSASSVEATELVDMMIAGAKQFGEMMRTTGVKLTAPELILISAAALHDNRSAIERLRSNLRLSQNEVSEMLRRAHEAARTLAEDHDYQEVLRSRFFAPGHGPEPSEGLDFPRRRY